MKYKFNAGEVIKFDKKFDSSSIFSIEIKFEEDLNDVKMKSGDIFPVLTELFKKLIVFAGKKEDLTPESWRKLGGFTAKYMKSHDIDKIILPNSLVNSIKASDLNTFMEGFFLGNFHFENFKEKKGNTKKTIYVQTDDKNLIKEIKSTHKVSSIINICREIGQMPGNFINPESLAEICQSFESEYPIKATVLDEKELKKIGATAITSVGKGSKSKAKLIILEYNPPQTKKDDPVAIVGKAITFDSGGYSIKTVDSLKGMKFDKMGGLIVLGTLLAASYLKIPQKLVGVICAAENLISDDAYRPDDIISTLSGKTVEILTTDAEGRLILADGLTYVQNFYKPQCIIDFATLTGGIVVALGKVRAGLFSNNNKLSDELFSSGENTNEKLWKMPLDDEYFELIKGEDSDLKNSGGREGHPILGAMFLKQFIENETPWAHIDIAGSATSSKAEHYLPKGATGFGIRLMLDYLTRQD